MTTEVLVGCLFVLAGSHQSAVALRVRRRVGQLGGHPRRKRGMLQASALLLVLGALQIALGVAFVALPPAAATQLLTTLLVLFILTAVLYLVAHVLWPNEPWFRG